MWTCRSGRLTIGLMPKLQSSYVAWALIEGVGYTVGVYNSEMCVPSFPPFIFMCMPGA